MEACSFFCVSSLISHVSRYIDILLYLSPLDILTTVMSQFYSYRPVMTPAEMIAWSKNI
eukprot:TRINITY_DN30694_c0_g1_i1.p1 TRINITY_DN30694_c0_g1~~TRINITY_DN30694_c0_g1_i1.p1  ORF type:complete len:59 (+),score=5.60 TRINITY_DN30694_c0_g1_i1:224-400(+)